MHASLARLSLAFVALSLFGLTHCGSGAPPNATSDCAGPGRYEADKNEITRACCPGLREVFVQKAVYGDGNRQICESPPLRVYTCVKKSCNDGTYEPNESEPCDCVADCPSTT